VTNGACAATVDCDFEGRYPQYCGWTNVQKTDDFDWTYQVGNTPSISTGPKFDHTMGDGRGKVHLERYMVSSVSSTLH